MRFAIACTITFLELRCCWVFTYVLGMMPCHAMLVYPSGTLNFLHNPSLSCLVCSATARSVLVCAHGPHPSQYPSHRRCSLVLCLCPTCNILLLLLLLHKWMIDGSHASESLVQALPCAITMSWLVFHVAPLLTPILRHGSKSCLHASVSCRFCCWPATLVKSIWPSLGAT